MSVAEVSKSEGLGHSTLCNWRLQAKERGMPVPGSGKSSDSWLAEAKFAVVVETASMNASQLSEYCRAKGLFPEQISEWKHASMQGLLSISQM